MSVEKLKDGTLVLSGSRLAFYEQTWTHKGYLLIMNFCQFSSPINVLTLAKMHSDIYGVISQKRIITVVKLATYFQNLEGKTACD